jgi:oxygen-independent coproporphyrinogen-3 oxidase
MAGIYIHIPFCRQACHYCNFHFATTLKQKDAMMAAIIKEIELTPYFNNDKKTPVHTIYFGGGTPSILDTVNIQSVLKALHKKFKIAEDAEITLEANPDDITLLKLETWKQAGINRLSIGIQSFNDAELQWMNRVHTAKESLQCIDDIRKAGFTNFSVDLIYGSPLLSNKDWKKNIAAVIEKNIPHISCYALTVEPKTALNKLIMLHKKQDVDPEKQAAQFLLLMQWMKDAGYRHYEISNFAKPGMQSRHNSSYWSGEYYYGFGPSAHSFNGKSRRWNIANNSIYLLKIQQGVIPSEEEILTPVQSLNEYIMTALRTDKGIHVDYIHTHFGNTYSQQITKQSSKWQKSGKLIFENEYLVLTNDGKLFADGIAADLFFSDESSS